MQAFPFTSMVDYDSHGYPQFDRAVDSIILRNIIKQYVTNGVFPNPSTNFQVLANSETAMTVKVSPGSCVIDGATGYEVTNRVLTVQASNTKDRIDTVVLRLNDNTEYRNIDLYIVEGTPDFTPQAPTLGRSGGIYELGIANIFVPANAVTITQERITDTRLDTDRCGYAMFMSRIDTKSLYTQIQSDLSHFKAVTEADVVDWVNTLKDKLSDVDAARLQIEIDNQSLAIDGLRSEVNEGSTLKVGYAENTLLGAHNLLPYPYPDETKTENGVSYTDNGDGTVTLNGKNTVDVLYNYFTLFQSQKLKYFINKNLKFSTGNSDESVHIQIWKKTINSDELELYKDFVGTEEIQVTKEDLEFEIRVTPIKNMPIDYVKIYPMITLTEDTDASYHKFAKTNEQLTDETRKVVLTEKLLQGETELVFTDKAIKDDSAFDFYTDVYGFSPKSVEYSKNTLTANFRAQQTDINVKVVITNALV